MTGRDCPVDAESKIYATSKKIGYKFRKISKNLIILLSTLIEIRGKILIRLTCKPS